MHRRQRLSSLPPAGETVARFTPRLTAGVGVLVAFLLLGGSATEAVADPGRSHSDRGNSSDRGNGSGKVAVGRIAAMTTAAATTTAASAARTTVTAAPNGAASKARGFSPDRALSSIAEPSAKPRRRQERRRGRHRRSGIEPCRRRRCRGVGAKPRCRLGRIAVRVDPARANSEGLAQQAHPIGPALIAPMSRRHGSVRRA